MYFLKKLTKQLFFVLLLLTLIRLIFWFANRTLFPEISVKILLKNLFFGVRFDVSSLFWVNSALIFLTLLPLFWRKRPFFQIILRGLFILPNVIMLLFELADIAWFPFNLRRMMVPDFRLLGETTNQFSDYLLDFWWILGIFCAVLGSLIYFSKIKKVEIQPSKSLLNWIIFVASIPIWVIGVRGGLQLRPIMPIDAKDLATEIRFAPLLPNATIHLLSSVQQNFIEEKTWFSQADLDKKFNLKRQYSHAPTDFQPLNVVTIALESCGEEYLKLGMMPFVDSLRRVGFSPKNGYANAVRSIQGNTAMLASIPALMLDPWAFSAYQNNQIEGLGGILRRKGYETAFFHGSDPGSMQLDKLAKSAGYDQLYDRFSMPDQTYYDGRWGIFDRPFLQFFAQKLTQMRPPFCAHFFTMSSHFPWQAEADFRAKHPELTKEYASFRYTDDAIRRFFEVASREKWFKNTLFVLAADHIGPAWAARYQTLEGKFRIPIIFFQPGRDWSEYPQPTVAQQVDILPSVLDLLGFSDAFRAFGTSVFQKKEAEKRSFFVFENNVFELGDGQYLYTFDGRNSAQLFDYQSDTLLQKNIIFEKEEIADQFDQRLKAIIQRHNQAMIRNELAR